MNSFNRFICKLKSIYFNTMGFALLIAMQANDVLAADGKGAGGAGLPTMQAPSRGDSTGIMQTIKNHAYDAVILAGLFIGVIGFLKVAASLLSTYGEIQDGKKKWSDLGMSALVGAILLVVLIWLITEASKIL